MRIATFTQSLLMRQQVQEIQGRMAETQAQVSTGKKADNFAALRSDSRTVLALRNQLATLADYKATISTVEMRLEITQSTLGRLQEAGDQQTIRTLAAVHDNPARLRILQGEGRQKLEDLAGLLNGSAQGRHLFGGTNTAQAPVASARTLLEGDPATGRIGLIQQIADRRAADRVDSTTAPGGVAVAVDAAATVTLTDTVAGFGFAMLGLTGSKGTIGGTPSATPPGYQDLQLSDVNQLAVGDWLSLTVGMPDGSERSLQLSAAATADAPGSFVIGATPADTAANIGAALQDVLVRTATTTLRTASASEAASMFFDSVPPKLVDDPTGTPSIVDDNPAAPRAVRWYSGETAGSARDAARAKIDDGLVLSYGVRADETAVRDTVKSLALLAAVPYEQGGELAYRDFAESVGKALGVANGRVKQLISEVGLKQELLVSVQERQESVTMLANNELVDAEGVDMYEVSTRLMQYETQLQASYQLTGRLHSLTLLNYLR